ncbi:hypothetical protein TcasGA2_TC003581 [Tribolium castaneum]|uniref:Uncharacterized protein n=1 Tax=Tribolium castaneum TaxID=7070 RepID=D6WHV6_TRICA|nr:hypothetical protein TcasGA2_TC003581 [Tribolium castaneum]
MSQGNSLFRFAFRLSSDSCNIIEFGNVFGWTSRAPSPSLYYVGMVTSDAPRAFDTRGANPPLPPTLALDHHPTMQHHEVTLQCYFKSNKYLSVCIMTMTILRREWPQTRLNHPNLGCAALRKLQIFPTN